jgi:Flp pilus assembly protein TadD
LGEALERQGRLEEASKHFREALNINPKLAGAANNLGAVLLQEGNWREAESYFRAALNIEPDLASARANLSFVLQARESEIRSHQ